MGETDFLLRIVCRDIKAYEAFFLDHLSRFPGVQSVNSSIALAVIKETTALPLRHRASPLAASSGSTQSPAPCLISPARVSSRPPVAAIRPGQAIDLVLRPFALHGQHPRMRRRTTAQHRRPTRGNGANARATTVSKGCELEGLDARHASPHITPVPDARGVLHEADLLAVGVDEREAPLRDLPPPAAVPGKPAPVPTSATVLPLQVGMIGQAVEQMMGQHRHRDRGSL